MAFEHITEGTAHIEVDSRTVVTKDTTIFYNPLMKKNRDLTISFLNALDQKDMLMLDLMAASGVRTIRLLQELKPGIIGRLVTNDIEKGFKERMQATLISNGITDQKRVSVLERDANLALLESEGFDYIDIDPYGSPNPFLENSIVRLSREGILAVTATDTAALCGARLNAGRRKYWAEPLNNELHHELGLRIFIRKVQLIGAQHDKALKPLFSYACDHYYRIFFGCTKGRQKVDAVLKDHQYFLYCGECMAQRTSHYNKEHCTCGKQMIFAGPLFTGPLSDARLVQKMHDETSDTELQQFLMRMEGDCTDIVGFYDLHTLAKKKLIKGLPKMEQLFANKALLRTHFCWTAVKTRQPELLKEQKNK